ncbi:MAG: tRNA (adenosine(37)-N6)-dimethylallyltransferase MiaA [Kiritimatiellia bacterium]
MITILGTTATGKTRLAVKVARSMNGEIISADSRQVYRRMDIGSGKDLSEYGTGSNAVAYHLIDIVEPGTEFNIFDYQHAFLDAYNDILNRNKRAVFCGGSGMYLDSVINRYRLVKVERDSALRVIMEKESDEQLAVRLKQLKPLHNTTDITDRERLYRAIEIAMHSVNASPDEGIFPEIQTVIFGLRTEREILKKRISRRLNERMENGMAEEIEGLLNSGLTAEQLEFYGLEYRFVTQYVTGILGRDEMIEILGKAIYQFARRQIKWFRRMERKGTEIHWLNAEEDNLENILRFVGI